jgi:hypothetical protein
MLTHYVHLYMKGKAQYSIPAADVPTILAAIKKVFPDTILADVADITYLGESNVAVCSCGWVAKSATDATITSGYSSKPGTGIGCGGGRRGYVTCGDAGPSWSTPPNHAAMFVKITTARTEDIVKELDTLGYTAKVHFITANVPEVHVTKMCVGDNTNKACFQMQNGDLVVDAPVQMRKGAAVEGRIYFRHQGAQGSDDSDAYFLEKVNTGPDQNSLRLTINDNGDEKFQIWTNSCSQGDCAGPGSLVWSMPA